MSDDIEPGNLKRRGLGRGLNALFGDEEADTPQGGSDDGDHTPGALRKVIGIAQIVPGVYQPRTRFDDDALEELASSLRQHGLLQPILVRPRPESPGEYEIVAGERRWRAAQLAQLHEIPVIIKPLDDQATLEIALIENLQRQDLSAIEEAQALGRLAWEFGYTQERIAEMLGKSRPHVANTLRLLDLPQEVQDMINDGAITAGHARALMTAPDPFALAEAIVAGNLSVRAAEDLAREVKAAAKSGKKAKPNFDANIKALEDEISHALGLKVGIDHKPNQSGKLSINYKSLDQLHDVLARLTKAA
jgi:ParB family chromosome partitioning protein